MTPISKSALWKKRLGDWVLNPYVGCEHGCRHCYCPAMPGVRFSGYDHSQEEWGSYLYPKAGLLEALKKQLKTFTPDKAKKTEWGDGWVLLSFLTDCYTPAEGKHKLTRESLKLILEAGHRVRLQTRSPLVERDFDILRAHTDRVLLGTSLPYLDDRLSRVLEPRAPSPTRRLNMLRKAASEGIQTYVAVAPFMPFHSQAQLDRVHEAIADLHPREVFCEVLNPKGSNLAMMRSVLEGEYPGHAKRLAGYSVEYWAQFTFRLLKYGFETVGGFVPWPDTQRHWKKHLRPDEGDFLTSFLPTSA